MKLERLDHFGIEGTDLTRAEHFYTDVLGLEVVNRFGDQVLLDCGGQNLALFEVQHSPLDDAAPKALIAPPLGRGHHAFKVKASDFAVARERLAAAGVESAAPIDWGDHDCIYFLDPGGKLLEMVSYR